MRGWEWRSRRVACGVWTGVAQPSGGMRCVDGSGTGIGSGMRPTCGKQAGTAVVGIRRVDANARAVPPRYVTAKIQLHRSIWRNFALLTAIIQLLPPEWPQNEENELE
ncbi:hypothetical protein [Paenibacillus sp. MSJ-34]|uniref:hypothetical protein n=1 Tax=Paenibacillus sp. MSJ-34 TaxID=2841529 RepID=UPI001C122B75|nr:hypothetical protein [Paenibacillus sp. MSJ-34]MBU5443506.1 hypothetical protein [Paenibacillus sp. MSJ-34]